RPSSLYHSVNHHEPTPNSTLSLHDALPIFQHVEPKPQITAQRPDNQQPWISARLPKTHRRDQRGQDRQVRNRIWRNAEPHAQIRRRARRATKHLRDRPVRCRLVFRHPLRFSEKPGVLPEKSGAYWDDSRPLKSRSQEKAFTVGFE